jgi:ribosomal protein S18 acetylase RimI-like enzyme
LFVKPSFQNLGIGQGFMGFVQRSHHALQVEVFQENQKAWRFYGLVVA